MNFATEMNMSNHGTRVNTHMHRAAVVDVEADDYSESKHANPETRPKVSCPPVSRRTRVFRDDAPAGTPPAPGAVYWLVVAASTVFTCYLIGVHVLARLSQP